MKRASKVKQIAFFIYFLSVAKNCPRSESVLFIMRKRNTFTRYFYVKKKTIKKN